MQTMPVLRSSSSATLRGGVHFAAYLERGNYCGLDVNPSLLGAGRLEPAETGLQDKVAVLAVSDRVSRGQVHMQAFDQGL
jgi:hypothetical protein